MSNGVWLKTAPAAPALVVVRWPPRSFVSFFPLPQPLFRPRYRFALPSSEMPRRPTCKKDADSMWSRRSKRMKDTAVLVVDLHTGIVFTVNSPYPAKNQQCYASVK